ncbi:MAG: hypothetical protein GY702_28775 [Desulfobulbaceae bacterium]|nr:hypothetical protein [Desulfobulbaceae bacterium]
MKRGDGQQGKWQRLVSSSEKKKSQSKREQGVLDESCLERRDFLATGCVKEASAKKIIRTHTMSRRTES